MIPRCQCGGRIMLMDVYLPGYGVSSEASCIACGRTPQFVRERAERNAAADERYYAEKSRRRSAVPPSGISRS